MMKHSRMQKKYFLRQLIRHLLIITLPILLLGIVLTNYFRIQLQKELAVYAERSKNNCLKSVDEILDTFSEQTAIFSTSPSLSLSISRLLNEQSLDYKNNVMKSIIPTIIGTAVNVSSYVDSIYIYYDNPYGNFFNSSTGYSNVNSSGNMDSEWLEIYTSSDCTRKKWAQIRQVRDYSFEAPKDSLSIFRRFDYVKGVMVLNFDVAELAKMLDGNQLYQGSYTLISDADANILFGNSCYEQLPADREDISAILNNAPSQDNVFSTIDIDGTSYLYYSAPIPEYRLTMIALLPVSEVFKTVNNMVLAFSLIILFSIVLSVGLSLQGTLKNFRQLHRLLNLFTEDSEKEDYSGIFEYNANNEYDLIFNNIITTFMSNNRLKLNLAQAQMNQKDAQLAMLQLQLNPHFIFNTLQTVDLEIMKSQPEENSPGFLIHNLSDILKYSLENTLKRVTIREEIEICKKYAEIQKLRYSNPFILYWEYEESVLEYPVIHLILQPILENSLHHAVKESPRQGVIKIKIFKRDNRIFFYVIDNGLGISPEKLREINENLKANDLTRTTHIGLYNTSMRLKLTYGSEASLHVRSKEGQGTEVSFHIPVSV